MSRTVITFHADGPPPSHFAAFVVGLVVVIAVGFALLTAVPGFDSGLGCEKGDVVRGSVCDRDGVDGKRTPSPAPRRSP